MRDLAHLASLVFNAPLLIRADKGEQILNVLAPRVFAGQPIARADFPEVRAERSAGRPLAGGAYLTDGGVAVWPIVGSLVRRGGWLDAECGLMSYGLIADSALDVFTDPNVRAVLLEMDTPGGEASGCFDTAELLRAAAESTGKPLWAHVNEEACSAGYALASAASRIWIARTGVAGSIGVVAAHLDVSEADKKAGMKWTFIHAGAHKVDGNMHEPLEPDALGRFQADIDDLYTMFVDLVSQNRGMTAEEIRATNADIFRGSFAVDAGLADEVGTIDQAVAALAGEVDELQRGGLGRGQASRMRADIMPKASKASTESTETVVTDLPANDDPAVIEPAEGETDEAADLVEDATEGDDAEASASAVAASAMAERARCAGLSGIAAQASRLGVPFNLVKAITEGMSVDAARSSILDAAASGKEISGIAAPVGGAVAGSDVSPAAVKSMWKKSLKGR